MHIVKHIYAKADGVKLTLLLLKAAPIANKDVTHDAPANVFFGRQLKAHLPVFRCQKSLNSAHGSMMTTMTGVQILSYPINMIIINLSGLSLTPIQSGCQAR